MAGALLLTAVSLAGVPYYAVSMSERVRSALHPWLRPSGYIGQSAGVLALSVFVFLWLYPLRKRYRQLAFTGSMVRWLEVHVALALLLPLIVAVHASWRFEGLIGLGCGFMMVVWLSGLVGRYLYAHIPRSMDGLELSADGIAARRQALVGELIARTGLPAEQVEAALRPVSPDAAALGIGATLARMLLDDLARWRAARRLRRLCARRRPARAPDRHALAAISALARREMALTQQARMLGATRRVFRFWHVVHRPFALAALLAVLVHVVVVVSMGATWFW